MNGIGKQLALRREELGHSLEVAGKFLGVSAQSVRLWESGVNHPRAKHLRRIAEYLQVSPESLLESGAILAGQLVSLASMLVLFLWLPESHKMVSPIIHRK